MALIFYNPHKNGMFGLTVMNWLNNSKIPLKYVYLLDLLKTQNAIIYCDDYGSSIPFNFGIFNKILKYVEIHLWLKINGISKAKILFNSKQINNEDYLFIIAYEFLQKVNTKSVSEILEINCNKLIHFSHYFFRTKELNKNISKYNNITIIAESNLKKNSQYFKTYFPNYNYEFYVLPFVVASRFKNTSNFFSRTSKCLAVGSFMTMQREDYNECILDYLNNNTIHPLRKEIYENKSKLSNLIECRIDYINEFWNLKTNLNQNRIVIFENFINKYKKKIKNNWGKSNHFKSNIVELYNNYKMVFSSDDAGELPSISFFEAMVCGCVNIAVPNSNLLDLGLIEDYHYIGFDGTLQNLVNKIEYFQKNENELEIISKNSNLFFKDIFHKDYVLKEFSNHFTF
jgi:hypothetical protein